MVDYANPIERAKIILGSMLVRCKALAEEERDGSLNAKLTSLQEAMTQGIKSFNKMVVESSHIDRSARSEIEKSILDRYRRLLNDIRTLWENYHDMERGFLGMKQGLIWIKSQIEEIYRDTGKDYILEEHMIKDPSCVQ